ncbi:AMP-binding protein [Kribbella sp. GL6]|uniref:AMP-binding protein n=1 Tax=Kribbella sp. GL6 TaxID=3419765 RepID=UPI003CFC1468
MIHPIGPIRPPEWLMQAAARHAQGVRPRAAEVGGLPVALIRSGVWRSAGPAQLVRIERALRTWGQSMATLAAVAAIRFPDRAAVICGDHRLTYAELDARCERIAAGLHADHGIGAGSKVAILCRNHPGFLEATLAASRLGADILFLNTEFAPPQLRTVLDQHHPNLLIHDPEFPPPPDIPSIHSTPPPPTPDPTDAAHNPPSPDHDPTSAEHHPPSPDHHPPSAVHHPPSPDHDPTGTDHHPASAEHHPASAVHHTTSPDHDPTGTDHHPASAEHHPASPEHRSTSADHGPAGADHHPPSAEHHPPSPDHDRASTDQDPTSTDHDPTIAEHHPTGTDHHPTGTGHRSTDPDARAHTEHTPAQHTPAQHTPAQHTSAQHTSAQHTSAQHTSAQHTSAQHTSAQHTPVARPEPEHAVLTSAGDSSAGDRRAGDRRAGDRRAGERGAGDTSAGERGVGDTSAGERGTGDSSAGRSSAGEHSAGQREAGDSGADDSGAGLLGSGVVSLDDLARSTAPEAPVGGRVGRITLLTSGTTGAPKGAPRVTGALGLAGLTGSAVQRFGVRAGEPMVVGPPLFHGVGLLMSMLALFLGSPLVVRPRFDAATLLADVEATRAGSVVAVPVMLRRLLELGPTETATYDLRSLRAVISGAAQLGAPLAAEFIERFGPVLCDAYGSSEVGIATIATAADLVEAPGTVGRPCLGSSIRILDDQDHPVPAGTTGRIFAGGGLVFGGYSDGTNKTVVDGRMSTGDLGHLDPTGRLYVDGREDDMIVSGGENVYPVEVEQCLAAHPAVAEAVVTGVPDDEFGQRLVAYVVLTAPATEDELITHVKSNLARYKTPRQVVILDELPRNATGKILRNGLSPP